MDGKYQINPHDAVLNVSKFMFLFIFTIPYYHEAFPNKETFNQAFSGDDEEMDAGMWCGETTPAYPSI